MVHAVCDNVQACCAAAHRTFNATNCLNKVTASFAVPLSDSKLSFDAAEAGRCIETVARAAEACESVDVTPCYAAFVGVLAVGAVCTTSFDCAAGADGFAVCDGHCYQPKRGALGDPCSYTCVEDGSGNPDCHSPGAVSSSENAACYSENGLVCVATATAATCQPKSADCTQDPAGSCPAGQACSFTSHQCYTPAKVGAACTSTPCAAGAYCEGGVCALPKANGAACTMDAACLSAKCETGLCVVFSAAAKDWCGDVGP
jgi:hypothetical protein